MKKYLITLWLLLPALTITAQAVYQPYSYQLNQKLNTTLYNTKSNLHTSMWPVFSNDSLLSERLGVLMNAQNEDSTHHSWLYRKIFQEHLIQSNQSDYTFYADYLPDLTIGRDLHGQKTTWLNTRGFQLGVSIGSKFSFYTSGYENQAVFPNYFDRYVNQLGIVSGQAYDHNKGGRVKDWSYVTALMSYTPVKYLNITVGQDKTFIGDGYRSLLLSDFAAPYPFLKLTANLGRIQYMTMWSYMDDPSAKKFDTYGNERRKWGLFQNLDWNITKRWSLGFFQSVIWADSDDEGHRRGFDFKYINPVIFLRNISAASGSPDNALLGFSAKYKVGDHLTAYGQLALDEFQAKDFFADNGSSRNKYGYQLGVRGSDLFKVPSLNYLIEYNGAKPYTYSQLFSIINYAAQNEPLAHPTGANFREWLGLLNYSFGRFDFSAELLYSIYGFDINGANYGKDIFQTYQTAHSYYTGNYTAQGLATKLYYAEGRVAYVLNAKYNLRLELGGIYRYEQNSQFAERTLLLQIGLRSSFRNLYTDIASYKLH